MAGHGLALVSRRRFCFCAAPSAVSRQAWRRWNHGADFPVLRFRRSYARGTRLHGNQFHPGGSRDPRYPQHVAIIMDGNGRWATRRLLPHGGTRQGRAGRPARGRGLRARRRALPDAVRVQPENWRRPAEEVSLLMRLFVQALEREVGKLEEQGVRLHVIGDLGLRAAAAGTHFRGAATHRPQRPPASHRGGQLRRTLGHPAGHARHAGGRTRSGRAPGTDR